MANSLLLFSEMEIRRRFRATNASSSRYCSKEVSGKSISPSIGLIDSRSVRTSHHVASHERGIDGGKKVKGRKEHIIVDTLGLPMAAKVHAANIHDSVGAVKPIKQLRYIFPRLKKIIADGGYRGKLADMIKDLGWELSVVL